MTNDNFGNASAYEVYIGRWSRLTGVEFVRWLNIPPESTWLDVGAGTGILTQIILNEAAPKKVIAFDLSEQYLEYARQTVIDPRVDFYVGDAGKISLAMPPFDVAVAGLVLNFVASAEDAVKSMMQAVRDGGTVAAYVWDYMDRMEMVRHFWDAAAAVDENAKTFESGTQYILCDPDHLQALFMSAGLYDIHVIPIDVETRFKDFDDYWQPFLGAQGSTSKYFRSLDDNKRNAIQQQLLKQLPIENDQSISLIARAWAVKGRK